MPIPRKRAGTVELRQQVADLCDIPISLVFITGTKRPELRIWVEDLDASDVKRLQSLKEQVKKLAEPVGIRRTSLSALHPHEAQKVENERRQARGKARKARKLAREKAK